MKKSIFELSRAGDVAGVMECLAVKSDLKKTNEYGFTALQCAAMGTNTANPDDVITIMGMLIEKGCPLEYQDKNGRTAFYLCAEFSLSLKPVRFLVERGASFDVRNSFNIHVVENALLPETREYISKLTGVPVPVKPDRLPERKIGRAEWKEKIEEIKRIIGEIGNKKIIALMSNGITRKDGFDDCVSELDDSGKKEKDILGFCFITRQDTDRAKETGQLTVSFWGSPDGNDKATVTVGKIIEECFTKAEMKVVWDKSAANRPIVLI